MKSDQKITLSQARSRLQRWCAYQERCSQKVIKKALEIGVSLDESTTLLAELKTDDFVNDQRFATGFVRGKFTQRKWGSFRLRMELKQRDLSEKIITKALQELNDNAYRATLQGLLDKKSGSLKESDPYLRRKKLADYVLRKGYESGLVWELLTNK